MYETLKINGRRARAMAKIVSIWLSLAILFAGGLLTIDTNVPRAIHILHHEARTVGRVSSKDCANHASVNYEFIVAGMTYTGGGSALGGGCDVVTIGQRIPVFYDAENPHNNSGREARAELWNEAVPIALVTLIFPTAILVRLTSWRRRSRVAAAPRAR